MASPTKKFLALAYQTVLMVSFTVYFTLHLMLQWLIFGMFLSHFRSACLDDYYASLLDTTASTSNRNDASFSDSDGDEDSVDNIQNQSDAGDAEDINISEILSGLATVINDSCISKFNISRNFMWEGTKPALSRKSFSPANKVCVKFTDDAGVSEGAVDLGGPMREFLTLVLWYLHDSQLFCGP